MTHLQPTSVVFLMFFILQKAPFDGTVYFSYCTLKYTTVVRNELFIKWGFLKNSIVSNFVYNIKSKNRVSWSSCQKLVKNKFLSMEQISSINLRHPRRHRGWLILIESHNWRFIAFYYNNYLFWHQIVVLFHNE